MRFHYGFPPEVDPPLVNPRRIVVDYTRLHLQALFLSMLVIGPALYFVYGLKFESGMILGIFEYGPFSFLGMLVGVIIAHELIHLFSHPYMGLSRKSYVGLLPKSFLVYASYQGMQARNTLLLTLFAPFVLLTAFPVAACLTDVLPGSWISAAIGISIINGMAASGDLILAILVLRIPRGAMIQGHHYGVPC